jgi:hypothetical protein
MPRPVPPSAGPIIALLSFVCSVGNVPLAAVRWSGAVTAFSFAGVADHAPGAAGAGEVAAVAVSSR